MVEFPTVTYNDKNYSIVYYEPTGDKKLTFVSKPKLVMVPDTEILQVSVSFFVFTQTAETLAPISHEGVTYLHSTCKASWLL